MNEDLKPCAHCGSEAEFTSRQEGVYEMDYIKCTKCKIETCYGSKEKLREIWNKRV